MPEVRLFHYERTITMATESETRLHSLCFTGHRPEKIETPENLVLKGLEYEIDKAISDGYTIFITGMARGVDIWAAEIILGKKRNHSELKLVCALPFDGFEASWSSDWQARYNEILKQADSIEVICSHYSRSCFQLRNKWMVDHSSRLIAVWNGKPSGTKNTIVYARKRDREVRNLLTPDTSC